MTSDFIIDYSTGELICQAKQLLEDNGKPWREKKMNALSLASIYKDIDPSKAARLIDCGTNLKFKRDGEKLKLTSAWFCRVRLCPMCQWRRSLKLGIQMRKVCDVLINDYTFLYLTLTVENVPAENLSATLDDMATASNRMHLLDRWRRVVKGI